MTISAGLVIETHPLTPDRWRDFSELMNSRWDTRHCWCMALRITTNYRTRTAATNRRAFKKVVDTAKAPPGVLAYVGGVPAGWCAVAPRNEYSRLARSRATAPLDDQPVWSIVCFFVRGGMRRKGLSRILLSAAVDLATQHGAKLVEGYPVDGGGDPFHGVASVFRGAGFKEVARRTHNRPFMRYRTTSARKRARAT
jgi:GNAT superfamily N-acetyltransferase